jgi:sugar lactone lactonase YvrE
MFNSTLIRAHRAFVFSTFLLLAGCGGNSGDVAGSPASGQPPVSGGTTVPERPLVISVVAGDPVQSGSVDGPASVARFAGPLGIAVDDSGNLYVADGWNHTIRKIAPSGQVSTLAGAVGVGGTEDGQGAAARFSWPYGLTIDAAGNLFVTDNMNIRKVSPSGLVSTAATVVLGGRIDGRSMARFILTGIAVADNGDLYVTNNSTTRKITASGTIMIEGADPASDAYVIGTGFTVPRGVAVDRSGTVYVADRNKTVSKVGPDGKLAVLAGTPGTTGDADGTGTAASFMQVDSFATDNTGNLYAADTTLIRKITPAGVVTTFAGTRGSDALKPGALPGSLASINGIAFDKKTGILYATSGHAVIKIAPAQ